MRTMWLAALTVACAAKKQECPPEKSCPEADADPDYVHVDRDQLDALCVATKLPQPSYTPDYAALVAPDGTRVPWLLVWHSADDPGATRPLASASDWIAAERAYFQNEKMHRDKPPEPSARSGKHWLNILCHGGEAYNTVITATLFDKQGTHAVAIRGDKVLDQTLPADAKLEDVFATAIELTNKLLGGPVKLAKHKLGPTAEYLDVASPWRKPLAVGR